MVQVQKKMVYKAFGFSITSEIPLPELPSMGDEAESIDIEIEIADLTKRWDEMQNKQNGFVIAANLVMFQLSDIATFAIQEGKKIIVSPLNGFDLDLARLWILGTCMGAILMQRRILPLHGSALAIEGKAYAIVGESGAGKSTLASAFLRRGFQLITDDVIAVSFSCQQTPVVTPSYPQQKLWQESLTEFGMANSDYRPLYQRETKYAIPLSNQYSSDTLPLAGVFELVKSEEEYEKPEITPIQNLTRFQTLFKHTYRNFLIPGLGLMDWHFTNSISIIRNTAMNQLRRPPTGFTAYHLVDLILDSI